MKNQNLFSVSVLLNTLSIPTPSFLSYIFYKMATSARKKQRRKAHYGPCAAFWGAYLWPRLQVSLAPTFHWQFSKRMCFLDVWSQKTNINLERRLCCAALLSAWRVWGGKQRRCLCLGSPNESTETCPRGQQCSLQILSSSITYMCWTCHSDSYFSVP